MRKIIVLLVIASLAGCKSLIEKEPLNFYARETFFTNEANCTKGIIGIYDQLQQKGCYRNALWVYGDLMSDAMVTGYSTDPGDANSADFDRFIVRPTNRVVLEAWTDHYKGVARANLMLTRIPLSQISVQATKDKLMGEAYFLRALFYFNLVRMFGAVPMPTTEPTSFQEAKLGRSSVEEIYALIVSDLKNAEAMLPSENIVGRANTYCAQALLAKVYLTRENYPQAKDYCDKVISSGKYILDGVDYESLFVGDHDNNKESIFEVQYQTQPNQGWDYTSEGGWVNESFAPRFLGGKSNTPPNFFAKTGWGLALVSPVLYKKMKNDPRRMVSIYPNYQMNGLVAGGTTEDFYVYKYRDSSGNTVMDSKDNYPVLRLADVILMRAEASAQIEGNSSQTAIDDLNRIRTRANLLLTKLDESGVEYSTILDLVPLELYTTTSFSTKADLLEAIWKEREIELAFESQRWFDLLRTKNPLTNKIRAIEVMEENEIIINQNNLVLPIPYQEMNINDKIGAQNPGY